MKPFDVIFFASGDFVSKSIRGMQKLILGEGDFSHVGILINRRMLPTMKAVNDDDELYVWESTFSSSDKIGEIAGGNSPVGDVESKGKLTFGVQIRPFAQLIKYSTSQTPVAWGQLINNPIDKQDNESIEQHQERLKELRTKLCALHEDYFRRSFQLSPYFLCGALKESCCIRFFRDLCCDCGCCKKSDKNVFCSQFVGIVLKTIGKLPKDFNADDLTPIELLYPQISEDNKSANIPKLVENPIIINKYENI
jgi:hypothetical protein